MIFMIDYFCKVFFEALNKNKIFENDNIDDEAS